VTDPTNGFSNLSSIIVASADGLRRMQEELHLNQCEDPGSNPGCSSKLWGSSSVVERERFSIDCRRRPRRKKEIEMVETNYGKFDVTAATYGLIQVVFADATERLAMAVFKLQQHRDPSVTFDKVFELKFSQILKGFKQELKQFDSEGGAAEDIAVLLRSCRQLASLSVWRNERIHARVRQVDDGLALYNSRTGRRLSIGPEESQTILQRLAEAMFTMEAHLPVLLTELELDKELDDFFKTTEDSEGESSNE
jgi:hypothetical protein